jgi:hypothetical protein
MRSALSYSLNRLDGRGAEDKNEKELGRRVWDLAHSKRTLLMAQWLAHKLSNNKLGMHKEWIHILKS